jgi:hypothetical protein
MNILCIESFCTKKEKHKRTFLFGSTVPVAILTTETSLWTCAWASGT